jgi:putative resolvase
MSSQRVSSQAQRPDLKNQRERLEKFCAASGLAVDEWIEEGGGGLNFKRAKFSNLIGALEAGHMERVVLAHKDRLARFGFELLARLARRQGCDLRVMNSETLSPERELVEDLMAITQCFSARISGLRTYRQSLKKARQTDAQSAPHPLESDG